VGWTSGRSLWLQTTPPIMQLVLGTDTMCSSKKSACVQSHHPGSLWPLV